MTASVTKRKVYLDLIRIIAICLVMFTHTGEKGYMLFTKLPVGSVSYWLCLFNAILVKAAVPLFFMVSGAVLLGKKESLSDVLRRFFRILTVLLAVSLCAYCCKCFLEQNDFSFRNFLVTVYTKQAATPLWYLYAYLAYVLMLPFLRPLAQNLDRDGYRWLFVLYGIVSILPVVEYMIGQGSFSHNRHFSFFITANTFFYPLAGYFFDHLIRKEQLNRQTLAGLVLAGTAAIAVCCGMTHWHCILIGEWKEKTCQVFFQTLTFLPAFAVFYAVRMFFERHSLSERVQYWIVRIGDAAFGVYLIEWFCRKVTEKIFYTLQPVLHTLPACWIWLAAAFILGTFIILMLKKIPVIRKFL